MLRTKWFMGAATALVALVVAAGSAAARPLSVEVWTDRGDDHVYNPGDAMQVRARTNDDAYLLVYEIDSEGVVKVLFPFRRGAGMVEGKSSVMLPPEDSDFELAVESATGLGYIVAIASRRPFGELPWYLRQYDPQAANLGYEGAQTDVEGFDDEGRVMGDPTVAIERIRVAVLGAETSVEDFATSYTTYYVGHEVRYPRYLCNDCHQPNHWGWWDGYDPYFTTCSVIDFRVNWNWCWGPCMWSAHTPYYYYVVRSDCPPYYYPYYANNTRWSSWGGTAQWNDLWGGPLTRYKSAPPAGYEPPPSKAGDYPRTTPPGWVATATKTAGAGYSPVGKSGYTGGKQAPGGTTYKPGAGSTPQKTSGSGGKGVNPTSRGGKNSPQFEPPRQATPKSGQPKDSQPKYEQPKDSHPQSEPKSAPPKADPSGGSSPKGNTPQYNSPKSAPSGSGGHKGGSSKVLSPRTTSSYGQMPGAYRTRPARDYMKEASRSPLTQRPTYAARTGGGSSPSRYEQLRSGGGSPARYQQARTGGGTPAKYQQARQEPSRAASAPQQNYSAPARSSGSGQAASRQGQGAPGGSRTKGH